MKILYKVTSYTFILIFVNIIFSLYYYSSPQKITWYEPIIFSFSILLNLGEDNLTNLSYSDFKYYIVIQKFINNFILALLAAYLFNDMINKKPPTIFPRKLYIRRRTSPGEEKKLVLMVVVGNKYHNKKPLFYNKATLIYTYINNNSPNANTQLSYEVNLIKNFNSFYFEINMFPNHFIECILDNDNKSQGKIDVFVTGRIDQSLYPYIHKAQYTTSDIIIIKTPTPAIYHNDFTMLLRKDRNYYHKFLSLVTFPFLIFKNRMNIDNYIDCTEEERAQILHDMNGLLKK